MSNQTIAMLLMGFVAVWQLWSGNVDVVTIALYLGWLVAGASVGVFFCWVYFSFKEVADQKKKIREGFRIDDIES
ncbi:MAG: hypothetical protein C9356_20195 [Oleiphilus sp.]|nr:MAG: hypothetical protein C9356_20195 [Oleiphilus sp.]